MSQTKSVKMKRLKIQSLFEHLPNTWKALDWILNNTKQGSKEAKKQPNPVSKSSSHFLRFWGQDFNKYSQPITLLTNFRLVERQLVFVMEQQQ